jgi:predicted pyridoxine 5'-phosphate oxidase superfamily flavin-nucleotide-binding protein
MSNAAQQSGPITEEIKTLVESQRLCYVATTSPDGHPNLSPKGSLKVIDDRRVAFAEMASPHTVANLRHDPRLEINVVDPFLRRGVRIRGVAEISNDADLLAIVGAGLGHEYPVRAAVVITVTSTRVVDSPVYLFTTAPEEDVRRMWEDNYGYRATRPHDNVSSRRQAQGDGGPR